MKLLPPVLRSLAVLLAGAATQWGVMATVVNFDDQLPGPVGTKLSGVAFTEGAAIVAPGFGEAQANTPPNILRLNAGTLRIRFDTPKGYVRVRVGNTSGGNKFQAVMQAFATGTQPVATSEVELNSDQRDVIYPLQVSRCVDRDIRYVDITFWGQPAVIIDTLEYGRIEPGTVNANHFDNLPGGAAVERLPGAAFVARYLPRVTDQSMLYGGVWSPPNAIQLPLGPYEFVHPDTMVIQFDPPQQYVQMRVGNPFIQTLHFRATLKAYDSVARNRLITSAVIDLPDQTSITRALEVASLDGPSIAAVELIYRDDRYGYQEVIDALVFGPRNPTLPPDSQPPQVTIQTPRNNDLVRQPGAGTTETSITVLGTAIEDNGFSRFVVYVQDERGQVSTTDVIRNLASGSTREYSFTAQAWLRQGANRIWTVATDGAMNTATNVGGPITVTLGMPAPTVSSVSPGTLQEGWMFRQANPVLEIPDARMVTIRGQNLHEYTYVRLDWPGGTFNPSLRRVSESELTFYPPQEVFQNGNNTLAVRVIDNYRNAAREIFITSLNVAPPPEYPQVYGFGFSNPSHAAEEGEYFSAFGWNTYSTDWWSCSRTWWAKEIYWPAYRYIMDQMASAGSCVGMSAASLLMARGNEQARWWDYSGQVIYPSGFRATDLRPPGYHWPECGPPGPTNLFGFVRMLHAVQLSAEMANRLLDQVIVADQIENSRGNPAARLAEIRANPTNWVLCMENRIGEGHAVVPYKVVGNRIYVYDNNRPYNHAEPSTSPGNRASLNSYVDVDPVRNEYTFPNLNYRGTWMFTFPISIWTNPRTSVGWSEIRRALGMLCFGAATPEYYTEDGLNRWGWTAEGQWVDSFAGAIPLPLLGGGEPPEEEDPSKACPMFIDNRHSNISIRLHNQGGAYAMIMGQGDRVFQLKALNGQAGNSDALRLEKAQNAVSRFSFAPALEGTRLVASLGAKSEVVQRLFQLGSLNVPAREFVGFGLSEDGGSVQFRNTTSRELHPVILLSQNGAGASMASALYRPMAIAQGASVTFTPQPNSPNMVAAIDTDGNGTVDETRTIIGTSVRIEDDPTAQDLNGNGTVDEADVIFGTSTDNNLNGVPDEVETPGAQITPTDGSWSAKTALLANTSEAQLMVRTGDIDNLGFGWPEGFDPFSGNETPAHWYPWDTDPLDPAGTDQIMVPSSYNGIPPYGEDGYTFETTRPGNLPRAISLEYASRLAGVTITNAVLQLFVDDFQAPLWGTRFEAYLNSQRAPFLEAVLNNLEQTGPIGKLVTVRIPEEFLPQVASGTLSLFVNDTTTGAGDGYALDFVKLLINAAGTFHAGAVSGIIYNASNDQPLVGAMVRASNMAEATTDELGRYALSPVPAGLTMITVSKFGFRTQNANVDVIANANSERNVFLEPVPTADLSVSVVRTPESGDVGTQFTLELTVANLGPDTAVNPMVTVTKPQGTTFISGAPPAEGIVGVGIRDVAFWMGDLPAGATRTATVTFQAIRRGEICTTVAVTGEQPDPDMINNNSGWVCFTSDGPYGGVFLSGHDADYHALPATGPNAEGAQHVLARAVSYATYDILSPRILLVTDPENPGTEYGDPRLGLDAAGYGFDVADYGSGIEGALDLHAVNFYEYDAVMVASTFSGWLKQVEIDILNARAQELIDFVNAGGGLIVLSQADSEAGATFNNAFGFLPAVGFKTAHQYEDGFALTEFGRTLGLVETDIAGNFAHGYFEFTGGLTPVDLDASGRPVSLAMRGQPLSAGGAGNQTADLGLEKVAAGGVSQIGAETIFILTLTNAGPDAATQIVLTDPLPIEAEFVSAYSEEMQYSFDQVNQQLTARMDHLDAGGSARISVVLRPLYAGALANKAWVSGLQADGNNDNNAAQATVEVLPVNTPPTVTLTSPTEGQSFDAPATVQLSAAAADETGIARVEFYADGAYLETAIQEPYQINWVEVPEGTYTVYALAIDDQGLPSKSELVTITVSRQNQAPTVALTAPQPGAVLDAPATLLLRADAADDSGVIEVKFTANGAWVGSAIAAPFEFEWTGIEAGVYVLQAEAYDEQGLSGFSEEVRIEVLAATLQITGIKLEENGVLIEWIGGKAQLEGCTDLNSQVWTPIGEPADSPAKVPLSKPMQFFRIARPAPGK